MNDYLDDLDRLILHYLQENARITNAELAQRVDLSSPGLQKRLRRLEEEGIIEGYATLVNREKAGFDLLCFIQVNLRRHNVNAVRDFQTAVQTIPEVLACYHLTGDKDYLLKIVVRNRQHLERFLLDTLTPIPGVDRIQTNLVLSDVKQTTALPIQPEFGNSF
jgi:DNA-binding Lrp family transcriptional regulator